ncbi:MAG: hypothetical protein B7Y12_02565 [Rhizobiales bacterium 24-66-13]|jgi:membrane fusion protein (multidrug efflux system)|nr:MAG: hypothetical protein B7Y12_02565 [Rhizobiales bacterium 24-66-13]OZB11637.1 MAG: hypothetical protein B7X67_02865 [Rhizobiales bacterium 39-66-18]HQS45861.1 HlyD family secretion protein [Xanthobacteraceae bacterium]
MTDVHARPESTGTASQAGAPAPAFRRSRLSMGLLAVFGVLVLAAAGYGAWLYFTVWKYEVSSDDAYVHADYVVVAPEVPGYLVAVHVQDNQPVKAGDLLAAIDPVPYQAAVREAEAAIRRDEALVAQVRSELAAQPAIIEEARASVAVSEATLTFAQQQMDRASTLAAERYGTVEAKQQAASQLGQARATLNLHRAALAATERRTDTLTASLAANEAALEQAKAQFTTARFQLDRTALRAPVDGVVGNRALRKGMLVQPGTQLLAVVPLHQVHVVANVKETNLAGIVPGQKVTLAVDAFPDRTVQGTVNSIAPAAGQTFALLPPDNATGNFTKIVQRVPVKVTIDADDPLKGRLRPGMSVTATIHLEADSPAPGR